MTLLFKIVIFLLFDFSLLSRNDEKMRNTFFASLMDGISYITFNSAFNCFMPKLKIHLLYRVFLNESQPATDQKNEKPKQSLTHSRDTLSATRPQAV
jgi:hypothetical protein